MSPPFADGLTARVRSFAPSLERMLYIFQLISTIIGRNMHHLLSVVSLMLVAAVSELGQSVAPSFEVASVKPSTGPPMRERSVAGRAQGIIQGTQSGPGRVNLTFVTLAAVIQQAYSLRPFQIKGPGWLDVERFDIVAKLAEDAQARPDSLDAARVTRRAVQTCSPP